MEPADIQGLLGDQPDPGNVRFWRDPQPDGSNRYLREVGVEGQSICVEGLIEATKSDQAVEISESEYYTATMNG